MKELLGGATKIEVIRKSKNIKIPRVIKKSERIKFRRKNYVIKRKL